MTSAERRTAGSAPGPAEPVPEQLAARVDEAVRRISALDGTARQTAEEVREAIEAVHRVGLTTIVHRMRQDERARELLFELVDDPVVRLLLSLHGIIRADVLAEAARALDGVRPALQSHGGDVELVLVDDGVAYVRLHGACNGCSMASVTMRRSVEEALVGDIPAITAVEVLPNEPAGTVIPLSVVMPGPSREEGWVRTSPLEEVPENEITLLELVTNSGQETEVIVVRVDRGLVAYQNACAHQGLPIDAAILDTEAGTLTCPWHGYCFDAVTGNCLSAAGAQLEQLPLRVDGGHVWIRVGT